jgi:hypothetical protein
MSFTETSEFTGSIPVYEVHPLKAIWWGVQKSMRVGAAEIGLTRIEDAWIRIKPSQAVLFSAIAKQGVRAALKNFLASWRQLDELRDRFSDDWDEVALSLWTLINTGLLEAADEPTEEESEAGELDMSGHTLRLPEEDLTALRDLAAEFDRPQNRPAAPEEIVPTDPEERIHYDFLKKMDMDHYAFLGVAGSAGREEISSAYDLLAPAYRLGPKRKGFAADAKDQAKQLLGRLFQAYEALSDEPRREAYDQSLLKAQTPESAAPGGGKVQAESAGPNSGSTAPEFSD